jgi:RNA polymerase sigma factor (sigma-70 family)
MNRLIEHLRTGLSDPDGADATDGELLERYIAHRDEAPFAALVRRHGPMVWGVCRRLLPILQDAEDAFQATFLVLVRKAASVVPRSMVGNWLYGVAYQTALKARAVAARRRACERQVTEMPERESAAADPWPDLQPVLDQELTRLPDRYRGVLVLCDIEGKTRKEAARQLGVPEGTVAGWLARARAMLARRLAHRGVMLSGGSLAAVVVEYAAPATVPAAVVSSTIEAAKHFAAGPVAAAAIPAPVVTLTEGVLKSMLLNKLKVVAIVVVAAAVVGSGLTGLAIHATAGEQSKQKSVPVVGPERAGKDAGGPESELRQIRAELEKLRAEVDALKKQLRPGEAASSPPTEPVDAAPKLVTKVYPIKDLLGSRLDDEAPPIMRVITNIVQPSSWTGSGGWGSIEYFAGAHSLVVSQTAHVQEQVQTLLEALRKAASENKPSK